jgi:hypothetical protein
MRSSVEENRTVDEERSPIRHVLILRRVEPERNVARFYAPMTKRDLFGRAVLVRLVRTIRSRRAQSSPAA